MLVTQSVGTIVMRRIMLDNFQTIEVSNSRTLPIARRKTKTMHCVPDVRFFNVGVLLLDTHPEI